MECYRIVLLVTGCLLGLLCCRCGSAQSTNYVLDTSVGLGRQFDGIGGLSGGGATSRLLVSYKEPYRTQILDYLFKPKFAASLQILKVEIGGDGQSTDGTESSHMHSRNDLNYQRGYEWWLMTEAKKRNPNIKLYGLSWAYPAWVANGGSTSNPYGFPELTADYIMNWVRGAKSEYNLDIDYVGIWNERNFNSTYIKTLRKVLDFNGFSSVQIVAADSGFSDISAAMLNDSELNSSVSVIGAHYPGTFSDTDAMATHKPLWASEDYSTYNNDVGSGCWARILNQNYVNGNMTSTISWNLIASYYYGLPYYSDGLMTATEPWSGHYDVKGPIWISAHTTQFSEIGYYYLKHGYGSGHLASGGSYVTLYDPQTNDFSIIIETMSHDHSVCIRPSLPPFTVLPQEATFLFEGVLGAITQVHIWTTYLNYGEGETSEYFFNNGVFEVEEEMLSVYLEVDTVTTITSLTGQRKGNYSGVPPSASFPVPYSDDFDGYPEYGEARYFADQSGVFEIMSTSDPSHQKVMTQVVPERPIVWCDDADQPNTIIGDIDWTDVSAEVSVLLERDNTSAFLAVRMSEGGCGVAKATGAFLWLDSRGFYNITTDLAGKEQVLSEVFPVKLKVWYTLQLASKGEYITALVAEADADGTNGSRMMSKTTLKADEKGFVAMGTGGFYPAQFDNFEIHSAT